MTVLALILAAVAIAALLTGSTGKNAERKKHRRGERSNAGKLGYWILAAIVGASAIAAFLLLR
ncbi:MAG: hypothetical protein ACFB9N_08985 [Geitlerinemataceae cyanobacterium]